ncbi:MAG: SoxR reducing system RseC family protein [candidate division WOR-3 bacterium]|nr:MAG: SoxR reducing system RseC family protein [candidate division WOR-3 bacterium]
MYNLYSYMQERGRVVELEGRMAKIAIEETGACNKCPAGGMCRPAGGKRYLEALNTVRAQVGDTVLFELSTGYSLLAIMLFFGLPVFLGLVGLIVTAGRGEIVTVIVGTAGFGFGLLIAKVVNDVLAARRTLLPRIIEVLRRDRT